MTLLDFIEREIASCGGIEATLKIIEYERVNYIRPVAKMVKEVFRATKEVAVKSYKPRVKYVKKEREPIIVIPEPKKELWTDEKLGYLVKNYNRYSNVDLSIKLHISANNISKKMTEMNLKRTAAIRIAHTYRDECVLDNNYNGWF